MLSLPPSVDGIPVEVDQAVLVWLKGVRWPNFVNIHDVWMEGYRLCILKERGATSLGAWRDLQWPVTEEVWFDIMCGITNGLAQVHSHNLVHGNLNPTNSSDIPS